MNDINETLTTLTELVIENIKTLKRFSAVSESKIDLGVYAVVINSYKGGRIVVSVSERGKMVCVLELLTTFNCVESTVPIVQIDNGVDYLSYKIYTSDLLCASTIATWSEDKNLLMLAKLNTPAFSDSLLKLTLIEPPFWLEKAFKKINSRLTNEESPGQKDEDSATSPLWRDSTYGVEEMRDYLTNISKYINGESAELNVPPSPSALMTTEEYKALEFCAIHVTKIGTIGYIAHSPNDNEHLVGPCKIVTNLITEIVKFINCDIVLKWE